MNHLEIFMIAVIFIIAAVSGIYPFIRRSNSPSGISFPIGEALANGVFLGAGLIHMLGDSASDFYNLQIDYPYPFLIAGITILFFLLVEHISTTLSKKNSNNYTFMAVMATIMLSIHSFFAGAALGLSSSNAVAIIIFIAIIGHKWAASFALSLNINKSSFHFKYRILLFLIFIIMSPLGILFGDVTQTYCSHTLIQPIFTAIAAGTFIYMGTLHGLDRSIMIKDCCNTKEYTFVILGFTIMAIVAIWT
jgi:solute carrier family 39 (zinc transporter), member 1/2/3